MAGGALLEPSAGLPGVCDRPRLGQAAAVGDDLKAKATGFGLKGRAGERTRAEFLNGDGETVSGIVDEDADGRDKVIGRPQDEGSGEELDTPNRNGHDRIVVLR